MKKKRIANLTEEEVRQFPNGTISFEEFAQEMYKMIEETCGQNDNKL